MSKESDAVLSRGVLEFTAAANEYCKYAEHASELKGDEILKIMQRLLPFIYIKASLLPSLEPFFEEGNEKFVREADWVKIHDAFREKLGTANDYLEVFDEKMSRSEGPVAGSIAEDLADIYQDLKDYLILYQTGTNEVMNDAIWECRMNFENYWGQKLVNSMRAIHNFIYSGEEIALRDEQADRDRDSARRTDEWFISRRQKESEKNGR